MLITLVVSLNLLNLVQTLIIIALALDIVQVVLSLLGTGPFFLARIIQFINLINQSSSDPQHICTSPLGYAYPILCMACYPSHAYLHSFLSSWRSSSLVSFTFLRNHMVTQKKLMYKVSQSFTNKLTGGTI